MRNSNEQNIEINPFPKKNNIVLNVFRNATAPLVVTFGTGRPLFNDKGITKYGLFSLLGTSALVAYGICHDVKENIETDSFVKKYEQEKLASSRIPQGQGRI